MPCCSRGRAPAAVASQTNEELLVATEWNLLTDFSSRRLHEMTNEYFCISPLSLAWAICSFAQGWNCFFPSSSSLACNALYCKNEQRKHSEKPEDRNSSVVGWTEGLQIFPDTFVADWKGPQFHTRGHPPKGLIRQTAKLGSSSPRPQASKIAFNYSYLRWWTVQVGTFFTSTCLG